VQEDFILVLDTDLYAGRYFIPELLEIVMADKDRSLIYGVHDQWVIIVKWEVQLLFGCDGNAPTLEHQDIVVRLRKRPFSEFTTGPDDCESSS
jgi:hypothetical protein